MHIRTMVWCVVGLRLLYAAPAPAQTADSARQKPAPFAFADFTWLNGNSRQKEAVLDSKYITGEFRADVTYIYDFNQPSDHTLVGTSESGRTQEIQVQHLGIGGDFHAGHARGRVMTQFGMYSTMTPRNDASPGHRAMEPGRRLPLSLGSLRRLPLGQVERHQRRRRYLSVLRRPVQLLQLRQLGVSALVRLVQHLVVLQRHSDSDLPERQAQDRAVADQWLAILRHVQLDPRYRLSGSVAPQRLRSAPRKWLLRSRRSRQRGPQARAQRQQPGGQVSRPAGTLARQGRVLAHGRPGLRERRWSELRAQLTRRAGAILPGDHAVQPLLVREGRPGPDDRRRCDHQSGPLSRAHPAHQRSDGVLSA